MRFFYVNAKLSLAVSNKIANEWERFVRASKIRETRAKDKQNSKEREKERKNAPHIQKRYPLKIHFFHESRFRIICCNDIFGSINIIRYLKYLFFFSLYSIRLKALA